MRSLARGLAAVPALLVLAVLILVPPALGASDQLGLSWDGRTWTGSLSGTLFDRPGSIVSWVPGDAETETFYVRNQSSEHASLRIDYDLSPDPLLSPADVHLSASVAGGAFRPLPAGTGWLEVDARELDAQGSASVAVRAVFEPGSGNASQDQAFPVAFRVTLTELATPAGAAGGSSYPDAVAPEPEPSAGSPWPFGSGLADTGAPELRWVLGAGLVCLGAGAAVVRSRRGGGDR